MNLASFLYYRLDDMVDEMVNQKGKFAGLPPEIMKAIKACQSVYKKYFDKMDISDIYLIAMVLDPRIKTHLLEAYFDDANHIASLVEGITKKLEIMCPCLPDPQNSTFQEGYLQQNGKRRYQLEDDDFLKLGRKRQRVSTSEITRWFKTEPIDGPEPLELGYEDWLLNWWRKHADEYPRLAIAAQAFLGIPFSEVAVERLFSKGRDMIGIRRY
ncbi:hypothetical protein N7495_007390 [Penicillium taxi]|uniref:uncharacterized protein n=1 Tax=Penicillium taxi TaxID=168475 RepID=UPI00254571E9|nr:uncharacterized protein N7495_007390 [Penicillium taxi]KAJ5895699.1 hypothetical protein N7495_007390 [Penicillium taxi]